MLGDLFTLDETCEVSGGVDGTSLNKMKKPPRQRALTNFVGLENQGATCYLNSLIQSMYMTPELRKGMFDIDPFELGVDMVETHEQETVEDANKGIIEPDEGNLSLLMSMGIPEHHARRALVGTKNGSLDAVFEYIEHHENDPEFNKPLPNSSENEENGKKKRKKPRFIPIELQRLFTQLQLIDQQAVSTNELTTKGFEWQNMDGQVQHDAHELNRLLLDALEKSLRRTSGETLCRTLYEGTCVNQIKCLTCLGVSERTEPYYDINLQIVDCADMCVSLRRHCAAELLTGDSAYQCDTCRAKCQALRSTVLRTIPKVLTFSCSRFRIDRSTNWTRVKVTSRSEFPLVLDMTAFSEASDAASRKDSVYDPLYENPAMEEDFVESLRASKSIVWLEKLLRSAEGVAKELIEQYGEAVRFDDVDEEQYEAIARHLTPHMFTPTDASFSGSQERMLYQLHAVIMHRGSAHSGHYFAYIRDNLGEGRWELPELEELRRTACGVSTQQVAALSSENGTSPMESVEMVPANGSEVSVASNTELPVAPAAIAPQQNGNAHIKEGTPNAAKPPAPQKATPQKAYLQDREVGAYIVEEASPLALIIKVMRAASPPSSKETHVHQRGANRPGKPLQGKPLPNARFKVNFIGTEVGNLIKNSWANAFKLKFGTLEAFMRAQTDLMKVFDNGEVFLLTNNIHVVSSAVYQQKFAKLAPPGGSGQQHKKQPQQPQNGAGNKRTPGRLFNSQQLDLAGNVDAQLARQLQAELDLERHQEEEEECLGSGAGAGAAPDSWETAGAKRKERKINIDGVSASSKLSTSAAASGKAKTAKAELTPQQARVAILSAEIVSHFYGNYFEFNDSTVEPISLGHLQRAFEGGDSAYLLVYRAISAPVDAHQYLAASRTLLRQGTANKNEMVRPSTISPPAYFVKEVSALNEQLQQERTKYELSFSNVQLTVHYPSEFTYASPLLVPRKNDHDAAAAAETGEADADVSATDPTISEGQKEKETISATKKASVVDIDGRQTVLELKKKLAEDFQSGLAERLQASTSISAPLPSAAVPNPDPAPSSAPVDLSNWVISVMKTFGEGFYVMETFPDSTPISDVASSLNGSCTVSTSRSAGTHVLLWDGKSIDGHSVLTGLQGYPKQLCVSMLLPGGGGGADASGEGHGGDSARNNSNVVSVHESKLFPSLYLPSTLSLLEFAHKLCDMCSVDPLRAMISVLCVASTSGKERTYSTTTLFNKGIVSGKALVGTSPNGTSTSTGVTSTATAGARAGMVMTSSSALGEFENLHHLLVEDCESRGLHTSSLTEALVVRKNAEWTVTVELDFQPSAVDGDFPATTEEDSVPTHVQLDIPKFCSVCDLKVAALKALQLTGRSFEDGTRLRLGANRGEQLLSDETCDLVAAGLRNGSVLYIEQGARPASDSLVLNIALVSRNSTEVKYNTTSNSSVSNNSCGERLGEVEVTVKWSATIESLRDLAGQMLLNLQPGWTARSVALTQGSGLRDHLGREVEAIPTAPEASDATSPSWMEYFSTPQAGVAGDGANEGEPVEAAVATQDAAVLKKLALEEFGQDFQGRRLRRTSWLKEPTDLLLENTEELVTQRSAAPPTKNTAQKGGKKGVHPASQSRSKGDMISTTMLVTTPLTVKDCGLKSGDTLLLEEGTLPVKGEMNIQLYVWRPDASTTKASSQSNELPSDGDTPATAAAEPPSVLEEATALRKACLLPLGSVLANERDQLEDLQQRVHDLLGLQSTYLSSNIGELSGEIALDRFLLREMRADLLPGRSFWTSESSPVTPTSAAPSTLTSSTAAQPAVSSSGANGKQPARSATQAGPAAALNPNNTLKKLGLRGERGLVIELLGDSQGWVRPPAGSFRVWVQELLNPGAKEGCALVSPRWPPLPVLINGGVAPTLGHLKRAVVSVLPELATEHMSVYKYQPQGFEWSAVIAGGVGVHSNSSRKRGGKSESNITQGPYFIKEGDQLCAFDSRSVRLAPGVSIDIDGVIRFALAEDLQLRLLRDAEREERKLKKLYKSAGVSFATEGAVAPRAARREVMLSLGSGFDFSDDEN